MNHESTRPLRFNSAEIYDEAILRLRGQMWVGILVFTFLAQAVTRLLRIRAGIKAEPLAIVIQIAIYAVIIVGLLLRKTRYAVTMQSLFQICLHLAMPFIILAYGGTRGLGDVALFACLIVAMLYGLQRWMWASFAINLIAFAYSLYLEFIGQPLRPLLEDASSIAGLKLIFYFLLVGLTVFIGQRFYNQLLQRHQRFAEEQTQLTAELEQRTARLKQINAELQVSRLKLVTTQEEERRRLRHDLQEHIGPTLVSLGYRAGAARNALSRRPDDAVAELNELEGNIKQTLSDVRRFVYALHPPMLDQLGLLGAIKEYVRKLDTPFKVALSLPEKLDDVSASAEISIFRLLQAVLDLATEYNTTSQMTVELRAEPARLHLDVMLDRFATVEKLKAAEPLQLVSERFNELGGEIVYADGNSAELIAVQIRGNVPA